MVAWRFHDEAVGLECKGTVVLVRRVERGTDVLVRKMDRGVSTVGVWSKSACLEEVEGHISVQSTLYSSCWKCVVR